MAFGGHVDAAIAESSGGHARLGQFTDLPILLVYQVEQRDGIRRIEVWLFAFLAIEEPVARYARAVRCKRGQGVDDDVIVEQVEQQVGVENNSIVAAQILRQESRQMGTARLARDGKRLDARCQRHGLLISIGNTRFILWEIAAEFGVHGAAMVTLLKVFQHNLPFGARIIGDRPAQSQLSHGVAGEGGARETLADRSEYLLLDWLGRCGEVQPDESLPDF